MHQSWRVICIFPLFLWSSLSLKLHCNNLVNMLGIFQIARLFFCPSPNGKSIEQWIKVGSIEASNYEGLSRLIPEAHNNLKPIINWPKQSPWDMQEINLTMLCVPLLVEKTTEEGIIWLQMTKVIHVWIKIRCFLLLN